ncbi:MAG: hypothetical protein FWF10_09535 [Clostridiales bacterium]|nr:hypothetical protein [Clostridiales bacterium]
MSKKSFSILLSILILSCFVLPLGASAEVQTPEPRQEVLIGTITVAEDGEVIVEPTRAAATLTCALVTSGAKYYAYAKITCAIPTALKVSVYLKNSAGTTLASSSNTGNGTSCTTQTTPITLTPGVYEVYATGSSNATPVSLSKRYLVP